MSTLQSFSARTGDVLAELPATSPAAVDAACEAAAAAFAPWQAATGAERAALLRGLAAALEADREALVALADQETALGPVRLNGELDRTAFQLRRFADLAERGEPFAFVDDPAVAGAPPAGHPAMQRWSVPLGPVAMFSASNFPFAFSVLGGDTASALAAGCPVVVKAHTGHLQLSNRVFGLIQQVLAAQGLPAGLVGLVQGGGRDVGVRLIRHPAIAAGAFTGSTQGGAALAAEAAARPRPIPFYGELGSVNPTIALPAKLATDGAALATTLAGSITLGCGQFCTNPGVILLIDEVQPEMDAKAVNDAFVAQLAEALKAQQPHAMLTTAMRGAFEAGVAHWAQAGADMLLQETAAAGQPPRPVLAQVSALEFIAKAALREEVFGPSSLIVRAASLSQALQVLQAVGGSLTVTLWGVEQDSDKSRALVRGAMAIAGRVLFAGVPTGVAVTAAQQHGGPWPSSTRPETTSVGDAALARFLRPVCLQDAPAWLTARAGRPV
ncbi:aldehyde dehydrogenase family protein [Ideonella livida]|uniref:Aldehyde dehydrogenase family protein n=1 Tax=Ideonella livida TaxID=2707176 RepID=A0A7C9TKG3_9BURK|nr:aldehyde dehydrogenase family protein [Ideonella livida]NDY90306.1 aldehyde dehydrogenase family protein [Ideonella livida]